MDRLRFITATRLLQPACSLHEFWKIFGPEGYDQIDAGSRASDNSWMSPSKPRVADVPRNLKPYFLCLLKKGPRWNVTEGHESLMPEYLAYLRRETESRRILFAGPITDDGEVIAVAVLQAPSAQEATAIVNENPGVQSGHFVAEVRPCYLPALDAVQVEYPERA
jgi:uncharacterized protein YciI